MISFTRIASRLRPILSKKTSSSLLNSSRAASHGYDNLPDDREILLEAKLQSRLTFKQIAQKLDRNEVWTAAAFFGQHPFTEKEAETLIDILDLNDDEYAQDLTRRLTMVPWRGEMSVPPSDPTVYRLQEIVQVYGPAIKALIHEEVGDGIMSAIDLRVDVSKKAEGSDTRILITLDGKFLPYKSK